MFFACLAPFLWLTASGFAGGLGANPIEAIIGESGEWALRLLLLSLAITPLKSLTGWTAVMRLRRMIGLFAFFYAVLHMGAYVGLDQFFDWPAIWADVLKRVHIAVGIVSFLGLAVLAATSPARVVKRLGGKRWRRLHRLVYGVGIASVSHFLLTVKGDPVEPWIYSGVLALLLAWRSPLRAWAQGLLSASKRPMTVKGGGRPAGDA